MGPWPWQHSRATQWVLQGDDGALEDESDARKNYGREDSRSLGPSAIQSSHPTTTCKYKKLAQQARALLSSSLSWSWSHPKEHCASSGDLPTKQLQGVEDSAHSHHSGWRHQASDLDQMIGWPQVHGIFAFLFLSILLWISTYVITIDMVLNFWKHWRKHFL